MPSQIGALVTDVGGTGNPDFPYISTRRGVEQLQEFSDKTDISARGGAKCGALSTDSGDFAADLQLVIDAWVMLPETTKVGILAMVRAAGETAE